MGPELQVASTDPARHAGACYAAANFAQLGDTLGYGRSAGRYRHHGSVKRVWLRPLHRHAAQILSAPFGSITRC